MAKYLKMTFRLSHKKDLLHIKFLVVINIYYLLQVKYMITEMLHNRSDFFVQLVQNKQIIINFIREMKENKSDNFLLVSETLYIIPFT